MKKYQDFFSARAAAGRCRGARGAASAAVARLRALTARQFTAPAHENLKKSLACMFPSAAKGFLVKQMFFKAFGRIRG